MIHRLSRVLPPRLRQAAWRRMRHWGAGPDLAGHVEGIDGLHLTGWVVGRPRDRGGLPVGLFAGEVLLAECRADEFRGDVAEAGYGDGGSGFRFELGEEIVAAAGRTGGRLTVRVLEGTRPVLGEAALSASPAGAFDPADPALGNCRIALQAELGRLAGLLAAAEDAAAPPPPAPALARHGLMFATGGILPEAPGDIPAPSGETAYLDYVAYRYRMDERFDRRPGGEDNERFLYWYITTYRAGEGWRVPLGCRDIATLNQPLVMPNFRPSFTRAMWWRLGQQPQLMARLTPERAAWFVYWWAAVEAPALGLEDCLVPERLVEILQAIHPARRLDAFALSTFTENAHLDQARLRFLDPGRGGHRRLLALCLMVMAAAGRPEFVRYLPPAQVGALLAEEDGAPCLLERFAALLLDDRPGLPPLTPTRFRAILRRHGYDWASRSFLTVTREGHRLHAAALPVPAAPPAGPPAVDVQMIGPFRKASGLGQAARLSQRIMELTGYSVNAVDFGMDNPAPEGFSRVGALSDYRRAKVNLIQLNAESIPLAFAYQPDVFSGAYNIAYVYWELDTPALCHYLGMRMIDELWVAADYGLSIYRPHTDRPVVNVGMCYEETGGVDRAAARAFVDARFRLRGDEFVFLVAFDSFSFVQRKNPVAVLESFRRAFPGRDDVRLIVKTQNRNSVSDPPQMKLWRQVDAIMAADPRIRLMNETLGYDDLLRLKKGSDCYISLHRSEGWGFGMIEAMALGVPVVATGYSANMDFCSQETAFLVDWREVTLERPDYIFVRKGQKWAEPDPDSAARQLRAVREDAALREARAAAALRNVQENFSAAAIARRYRARLDAIMAARGAAGGDGHGGG